MTESISVTAIILVTAIFILAGLVKGVIGMGLPTIAIGLLGLVIAPVEAAAMLVLPSQTFGGYSNVLVRCFLEFV
jgi:uncharacterized membrane protein YfcA